MRVIGRWRRDAQAPDEDGFALLLVLWSLILLSLIIAQLLAAGRRETQLAGNLRQAAVAEAVADSAVQDVIYHLLTRDGGPPPPMQILKLPGGIATIRIRNLAGMVNPNMAPAPLLTAILEECGAAPRSAVQIMQAITDWRSPNDDPRALIAAYRAAGLTYAPTGQAFQTRDEIRLVLGMTPTLADCLVPHLSVFTDVQIPVPAFADPIVMRALVRMMRQNGEAIPITHPLPDARAVEIIAEGTSSAARFVRDATVRFSDGDSSQPYRILTWSSG